MGFKQEIKDWVNMLDTKSRCLEQRIAKMEWLYEEGPVCPGCGSRHIRIDKLGEPYLGNPCPTELRCLDCDAVGRRCDWQWYRSPEDEKFCWYRTTTEEIIVEVEEE